MEKAEFIINRMKATMIQGDNNNDDKEELLLLPTSSCTCTYVNSESMETKRSSASDKKTVIGNAAGKSLT
jgi:hypothetical protein